MMKFLKHTLLFAVALVAVSCSESNTGDNPSPEAVKITLSESAVNLQVGEKATVVAAVEPTDKSALLEWFSADESVATVSGGVINGVKVGSTTIYAFIGDVQASCEVNVTDSPVKKITLDKSELPLGVGESATLTATIEPEEAASLAIDWFSSDETVATVDAKGLVTAVKAGEATITAKIESIEAKCKVTVTNIEVTSIKLDITSKEIAVNESFIITATISPDNATIKDIEWNTENATIATVEQLPYSQCKIAGCGEGSVKITAYAADGKVSAECAVTVKKADAPLADAKIGDYFYSDGTWSDGGLVSINADGTDPVWAETKPAPIEGKTVIGIVFQTNSDRIAYADKQKGYTHGYVVACKKAHAADKHLTAYCMSGDFECLNAKKAASTWYYNVDGSTETATVLTAYAGKINNCPLFDWTTTDFQPAAPSNTSGWFVPATGQVWDMLANLCGGEVAEYLASQKAVSYDATYYLEKNDISYDALAALNEKMALVPDDQKELFEITDTYRQSASIWTSSYYTDDNADIFMIGKGNKVGNTSAFGIAASCAYMDSAEAYACPVLAF